MTYNWYDCGLPHGAGDLCLGGSDEKKPWRMMKRVFGRVFRKIVSPVLYWSAIASLGVVFSYMNVMYTEVQAGEIQLHVLADEAQLFVTDLVKPKNDMNEYIAYDDISIDIDLPTRAVSEEILSQGFVYTCN